MLAVLKKIFLSLILVSSHTSSASEAHELEGNEEISFQTAWSTQYLPNFYAGHQDTLIGVGGIPIAWARFDAPETSRKSIVLIPGYAESYLFYPELIYQLNHLGYNVFAVDLRGMGLSGRLAANPQIVHIDRFANYVRDVETFVTHIVKPATHGHSLSVLTHSTGGLVAAELMAQGRVKFDRAVLVSPLFGMRVKTTAFLDKLVLRFYNLETYAPGYSDFDPNQYPLSADKNTHSAMRHEKMVETYITHPTVIQGGPSVGWVLALHNATKSFRRYDASKIKTPTMIFQASEDLYVDVRAQNEACAKMRSCRLIRIDGAYHHILFELNSWRTSLLARIKNFL